MTSVMYRHSLAMTWVTGQCREPLGNPPYPVFARQIQEYPMLFKGLARLAPLERKEHRLHSTPPPSSPVLATSRVDALPRLCAQRTAVLSLEASPLSANTLKIIFQHRSNLSSMSAVSIGPPPQELACSWRSGRPRCVRPKLGRRRRARCVHDSFP